MILKPYVDAPEGAALWLSGGAELVGVCLRGLNDEGARVPSMGCSKTSEHEPCKYP